MGGGGYFHSASLKYFPLPVKAAEEELCHVDERFNQEQCVSVDVAACVYLSEHTATPRRHPPFSWVNKEITPRPSYSLWF